MWDVVALPLAIFLLKVMELTVSTIRTILAVSSMSRQAALAGFVEAVVGVTAMGAAVTNLSNPLAILAFAAGFAVGILSGTRIEEWLALGLRLVQVVNPDPDLQVASSLRSRGYRVTSLPGVGRMGSVEVSLALVRRRSLRVLLSEISSIAPNAFITVQRADRSSGGSFMAEPSWWETMRRSIWLR